MFLLTIYEEAKRERAKKGEWREGGKKGIGFL